MRNQKIILKAIAEDNVDFVKKNFDGKIKALEKGAEINAKSRTRFLKAIFDSEAENILKWVLKYKKVSWKDQGVFWYHIRSDITYFSKKQEQMLYLIKESQPNWRSLLGERSLEFWEEIFYYSKKDRERFLNLINAPMTYGEFLALFFRTRHTKKLRKIFEKLVLQEDSRILDNYPILKDKLKYEKTIIVADNSFLRQKDVDGKNFDSHLLFGQDKLSTSCEKIFGISSKVFMKNLSSLFVFSKNGVQEDLKVCKLDIRKFKGLMFLSEVYIRSEKPNVSRCLEIMESGYSLSVDEDALSFLFKCFSKDQLSVLAPEFFSGQEGVEMFYESFNDYSPKHIKKLLKTIKIGPSTGFDSLTYQVDEKLRMEDEKKFNLNQHKTVKGLRALEQDRFEFDNKIYRLEVARTNHDLIKWGMEMGHCIGDGDYAEEAADGIRVLMALWEGDKRRYAVDLFVDHDAESIKVGEKVYKNCSYIEQVQGKGGSRPSSGLKKAMESFLKKHKLL